MIAGKREQLVGQVRERHGIATDEAEEQVDLFASAFQEEDSQKTSRGAAP